MYNSKHKDINNLLQTLVSKLQENLGDNLIGVYLFGSLVWGDFNYKTSDIDLLVATKNDINKDINKEEFSKLDKVHKLIFQKFPKWDNRIEIAYISLNSLKTFKNKTYKIACLGHYEEFHIKDSDTSWPVNFYLLQKQNITLFGPEPKKLITPITQDEFIYYIKELVLEWKSWITQTKSYSVAYHYYAVLTICRAYYVLHHKEQGSKLKAGQWMMKKFPKWEDLIKRAISQKDKPFNKDCKESSIYPEVFGFVSEIINIIEAKF